MIDTRRLKVEINAQLWAWFQADPLIKIDRETAVQILAAWIALQEIGPAVATKLEDTSSDLSVDEVLLEAMRVHVEEMSGAIAARVSAAGWVFRKASNYLVAQMARLRKSAAAFL